MSFKKLSVVFCMAVMIGVGAVHAQLPSLTDPVDAFAAKVLNKAQTLSFRDGTEYCGLIGYDEQGKLVSTEPQRGDRDGCDIEDDLSIEEIIASYHTHGSYSFDADAEVPSVEDLEADFDEGIDGYVATPGGRLWLNYFDGGEAVLLCGRGCLHSDPDFRACEAFMPKNSYTIRELEERSDIDDGEC